MRFAALPLIASFALLAAPAFAQSGPNMPGSNPSGFTGQNTAGMSGSTGYTGQQGGQFGNRQVPNYNRFGTGQLGNNQFGGQNAQSLSLNTEQKIRQALEQNGFRNVRVAPRAFVIHAQAPDGSRVVMEIAPDVIAGVVASNLTNRMGMAQRPWQQNQGMGYGR